MSHIRLWQLISPTLPIGAFAYSQGQEYAIDCGWITDERGAYEWIAGLLENVLAVTEVPIVSRCYQATVASDPEQFRYWNEMLLAMRESVELYQEDLQLGAAMVRIMPSLGISWPAEYQVMPVSYAAAYGYACAKSGIDRRQAMEGMLWAWCENQVAAAIKLVPLGQSAGQRILSQLAGLIINAVALGEACGDDDIGMVAPGFAMASAMHETQYSRLFRS